MTIFQIILLLSSAGESEALADNALVQRSGSPGECLLVLFEH